MGFTKATVDPSVQQKLFDPEVGAEPYKPKQKFTKLGKADEVFTKRQIEGKPEDFKYYVIPSARGYRLESLSKIEERYANMPATEGSARILRLCGHVRYLRRLLDDANISYDSNGAVLSELAREWNIDADDVEWNRREERIGEIMIRTGKKREEIDLNLLRPENDGIFDSKDLHNHDYAPNIDEDALLTEYAILDTSGQDDEGEEEQE